MEKLIKTILVSSLALAAAGSGGCFSIKLDGEVREDVSYRVGFEDGIEVISLDDIEMLVTTNGAGCRVSFYAVGDFVVDDGKVVEMAYDKYMAIGILPLFAKTLERSDDAAPFAPDDVARDLTFTNFALDLRRTVSRRSPTRISSTRSRSG